RLSVLLFDSSACACVVAWLPDSEGDFRLGFKSVAGMIRCFSSDIRAHFAKVGEYMRDCRVRRDQRLVDIRVQCHNFNDFMHSSVGAAHSQLIREIIDSRRPPYDVNMMGFAPQAVVKVIDWMYYGEIEVVVHEIGEYLAVTGAMGIEQLHKQLEVRLQQCAIRADLRIAAINIATEPRYKVSAITQSRLVALIASETDALTQSDLKQLTPKSVIALVSDAEVPFVPKVNLLNDAVQWLKLPSHAQYMDLILSSVRIPYLNTTELYSVITEIRNRLMSPDPRSRETVYVYTPDGKRIVVGCGPEKYSKSAGVVVPHPAPSTDIGEEVMETTTRQQTSTTTETKQTVRSPIPLQQRRLPMDGQNPDGSQPHQWELSPVGMGKKGRWGLPHENIYRPNQKGSQELINARAFTSDERAENDALPDLIGHGHKKYPRSDAKNKSSERQPSVEQKHGSENRSQPSTSTGSLQPQSTQSGSATTTSPHQTYLLSNGPHSAKPLDSARATTPQTDHRKPTQSDLNNNALTKRAVVGPFRAEPLHLKESTAPDALIGPFRAEPIHMQPNQMPGGFNRGHEPMPHPQMANQLGSAPGPTQGFGYPMNRYGPMPHPQMANQTGNFPHFTQGFGGPMNGREPLPNPQMMNQLGNVPGFTAGFGPGGGFGPMQRPQTPELRNLPRDTRGFGHPGGGFGPMQRPQTPEELRNLPRDAKEFGHRGDGFGPMQRPQTPEELRNLPRDAKEFGHPGGGFGPMQRPRTPDELRSVPGDTSRFGHPGGGFGPMQRPQTPEELRNLPRDAKEFGPPGGRFGSAQRPRTPDELRSVPGDTKGFGPPGRSFGPMQRPQTPEELRHLPGDSRGFGPHGRSFEPPQRPQTGDELRDFHGDRPPGRSFGPMQRPQTPGKLRNFPGDVPPGAGSGSMPRPQTQDQLGAVPHETKGFGGNDPGGSRPLQNQIPGPYGDNRGFGEVRHPYRSPSQQRYSEMPHATPYQMGPQMAHQMPPHMQSPVPPNMQQQQMIPRMYPREQPGQIPADEHRQPQAQSHMMPQAQQHMPYHLPSTHPSQIPPGAMMPPTRLQNQMYPQPQFTQHPSQPQTNDRGTPPQTGPHVPFAQSMPIPRDAQMRPQMPPMQADHNAAQEIVWFTFSFFFTKERVAEQNDERPEGRMWRKLRGAPDQSTMSKTK
ncbi:hypothetical protein Tcan_07033, partial [Toxocara canis]